MGIEGVTEVASIELVRVVQPIYNINVAGYASFFVSVDGNDFFLVQQGN